MKKIIFILLMFPVVVFGNTCDVIEDTQTSNSRRLVCDAEKITTTKFKTNNDVTVLNNDVCTIKCSEEIVFSIDPVKKVLAGTSFNYPLYASGERKCTAEYKYQAYETKIRQLVSEYESLTGSQKTTKGNEITNYHAQKKACDEFTLEESEHENKYAYAGDVKLKLETSTNEVNINYVFEDISEYSSVKILDEIKYNTCDLNENNKKCTYGDKAVIGWTETARIFGKYTMEDVYLEKYTGEVKDVYNDKTCNAGDRYFVDYNEITRPATNDTTDKGYKITLTARKLGHNMTSSRNNWSLDVECWYQVKNMIYPQNNIGGVTDENYEKYGNTAFKYRLIDLNNPFPDNQPGANWKGKESIITSTAGNITTLERFVIALNRSAINKIREYNDVYPYDTFNLTEMEQSKFIELNTNIIDRR